ncbi:MAG: gliding motility-associated C-terminal domain-containing protein [Saprospiraceae bacterium]|nr:gliding motility-associated C-terminal domain-containing protein [Saprospiraceae bacterium]
METSSHLTPDFPAFRTKLRHCSLFIVWVGICSGIALSPLSAQCDVTLSNTCGDIQASGGLAPDQPTVFCGGQTVKIVNNSSPASEIGTTYVDWGDGNCEIFPGCPLEMTHVYAFSNDTCVSPSGQITFIIRLAVEKVCVVGGMPQSSFNFITFPLAVRFPPVALFGVPGSPCAGLPVTLFGSGCENDFTPEYLWTVNGVPVGDTKNLPYTFPTAGSYEVSYFISNDCSTDTFTQTVTVLDPPEAAISVVSGVVNPNKVCIGSGGGVVVLDGSLSLFETLYEWSISPSLGVQWQTPKDTSVVAIQFNLPGVFTIKLRVRNGCNEPSEITLALEALVGEALSLVPQPDVCAPLSYSPLPLSSNASYTLNGTPATFPTTLDIGQYILVGTLTNICGMQEVRDTFELSVPVPVNIITPPPFDSVCLGSAPILLTADQPGVIWEGQNISSTGGQSFFNPNAQGSFLAQAVFRKNTNCETRDSVYIFVKNVTANAQNIAVCPGTTSVPLIGTPAGGQWDCPTCPACVQNNQFVLTAYTGSFPVSLTYTVTDGECVATASIQLTVNVPQASFSLPMPLCEGANFQPDASGASATSFEWRIDGQPVGNPPFSGLTAGEHTLEQVAILAGCRDSITQIFTVTAPPPSAVFTADPTTGCSPLVVTFSPQEGPVTGTSYKWSFPGAEPSSGNEWTPPNPVVFSSDAHEVVLFPASFSTSNECGMKTFEMVIQINPKPFAELGIDSTDTGCSPHTVIITNRARGMPDVCLLTLSDGFSLNSCFDSLTRTFYASAQTTQYFLHLWTQNECGESEWTDTVTVVPPGVKAFFEMEKTIVCPFAEVAFKDASTPVPSSIQWNFGDGGYSNQANPIHVFTEPNTTFEVVLKVSTGCGYDTMRHFIQTLSTPTVAFEVPPIACAGQEATIINQSPSDLYAFYWDFGDGNVDSTRFDGVHTYEEGPAVRNVRLTVVNWDGCANTLVKKLEVRGKPVAGFYALPADGCSPLTVELVDTSRNVDEWRWFFGDGTVSEGRLAGKIFEAGTHSVKLVVSHSGLCTDSITVHNAVKVRECNLYIPNVFAPSSAGSNAIFTVFGGAELENINRLRVWDRWGNLVFNGIDLPPDQISGWDGRHEGKPMNPAVFVYEAEVRFTGGRVDYFVGDVTLVR